MFPQLRDGKVMVPIIPSRIETSIGWIMADGLVELKPGDEHYTETLAWLLANPTFSK